jgi:LysR family carnitine catabolism transcriptional activator
MLINCSLRELDVFLTLADTLNYRRAAERLHLSQPAVSGVIQRLEESLGSALFERSTRAVRLTEAGLVFQERIRLLRLQADAAVEAVRDVAELREGRVRVAALPSLAAGWLPGVFAQFMQAWPGIRIDLDDALSDACIALVRGGQADFALAASGAAESAATDLHSRRLCSDRFHLVCPVGHPLASEARLTARKLAPWPFIQMARHSSVRQALDAALHPLRLNAVFEVEHLATVMGLVEAGLGISVVPALTLFHFRRDSLVTRPLPIASLTRTVYLVRRREGSLSVAAQALHDLIVARLGSLKVD